MVSTPVGLAGSCGRLRLPTFETEEAEVPTTREVLQGLGEIGEALDDREASLTPRRWRHSERSLRGLISRLVRQTGE